MPCTAAEIAQIQSDRDAEWRAWIESAPGKAKEAMQDLVDFDAWHDNRPDKPDDPA